MRSVVHFKSNQSTVLLFKMFPSMIFVIMVTLVTSATVKDEKIQISDRDNDAKYCLLPPFPEHGQYTVSNNPFATPGRSYQFVQLDVSCDLGYINNNTVRNIFCINGEWSATMPRCVPDSLAFCTLTNNVRVEYRCLSDPGSLERSQECPSLVPSGTIVRPICRSPAYFSLRMLPEMRCRDGIWDYNPICKPACGLITQHRKLENSSTNHVELPWHAVIYQNRSGSYNYKCSGSLITENKIISNLKCFDGYRSEFQPRSYFVVAVNKMYLEYNDPRDKNSQQSDVVDIKISSSYRSPFYSLNYFMENIAIAVVERDFIFHLSVRPVCLDFDHNLDRTQLTQGNSGKVALWIYDNYNAQPSSVLNVVDLEYIKIEDCYGILPIKYRQLFNVINKFCTGYRNGTDLHTHNIFGAGLAFLESTTQRYYLRGVFMATIYPQNYRIFASIINHEHFIEQYL